MDHTWHSDRGRMDHTWSESTVAEAEWITHGLKAQSFTAKNHNGPHNLKVQSQKAEQTTDNLKTLFNTGIKVDWTLLGLKTLFNTVIEADWTLRGLKTLFNTVIKAD